MTVIAFIARTMTISGVMNWYIKSTAKRKSARVLVCMPCQMPHTPAHIYKKTERNILNGR